MEGVASLTKNNSGPLPAIVEDGHGDLEPVADASEHVLHGDGGVLEVNLRSVGALEQDEWYLLCKNVELITQKDEFSLFRRFIPSMMKCSTCSFLSSSHVIFLSHRNFSFFP